MFLLVPYLKLQPLILNAYLDRRHQTPQSPLIAADELDPLSLQEQTELISQRLQQKYNL